MQIQNHTEETYVEMHIAPQVNYYPNQLISLRLRALCDFSALCGIESSESNLFSHIFC